MDASQAPTAPPQSLERAQSPDRAQSRGRTQATWSRFARRFVAVFLSGLVAIFAVIVAVDPLDSGRFPRFTAGGPLDSDGRVADVSRGQDPRFDAAIIGNSHLMLLDPKRLSAASGLSFVQLAVPAERKREDAVMVGWFRRNHAKVAAFVINADSTICDRDPTLPLAAPFPFWLYGSDVGYLSHLMSADMLRIGIKRVRVTMGLAHSSDPSGPVVEEQKLAFGKPPLPVEPPPTDLSPALLGDAAFPAMDHIAAALEGLSSHSLVVFVTPPAHISVLPLQGTEDWREMKTCKYELARRVAAHPNWRYLDYFLDTPETRNADNFVDNNHYRALFARKIEGDISEALRPVSSAALIGN
ncbi:hypothetical protein SAMN05519103_04318 [Rhizobiales bacterium GAS113]|jgi:hypothetical protein|nr:hypothetical protein SAMN05519103_04318 [Rhizobiales bacterium GAS113]SEE37827.1 hypothetical protein SAMN05519104_5935 [Rhizobiales bacterium GAS188]